MSSDNIETSYARRNSVGLFLISITLGGLAIFLWLGRGRLAIMYLVLTVAAVFAWFAAAAFGAPHVAWLAGIDVSVTSKIPALIVALLAFIQALRVNKAGSSRPWYSRWYVALLGPLALFLGGAFLVRTFFFQPFSAPSTSNMPYLMVGDHFLVSKTAYHGADPQRGDMAVFKLPTNPDIDYVKRVIGLPGDKVQMKGGILYLNGTVVPRTQTTLPGVNTNAEPVNFYREDLPGGRSYVITESRNDGAADNTEEYVVPPSHYFVMGDNRDNSLDSRFLDKVGYIPRENFVGPVLFRFWNSEGHSLHIRPEGAFVN